MLLHLCVIHLVSSPFSASMFPHLVAACASILFLVGLWTPIVGTLIAMIELWVAFAHLSDPWLSLVLATIGGTSAMLGPGAFSVDARLFGRRHLEV
jgi:putative oxidoreductase